MRSLHWIDMRFTLTLVVFVAGCASAPPVSGPVQGPQSQAEQRPGRPPPNLNLSGFSVAFRDGYVDGCESGRERGVRRDEGRYKTDLDYVMGWNDGYSVCRR